MKRFLILGVALALMAVMATGASAAERKGTFGVSVGGGVGIPMGAFSDESKLGWRAGSVGFGYFVTDQIAIGAQGAFAQNKAKDEVLTTFGFTDAKTRLIEFGALAKYFFKMQSQKVAPYVKLGLGGNSAKFEVTDTTGGTSTTSDTSITFLGGNLGVGALFDVTPTVSVFVEGAFHNYAKKDSQPLNYIAPQVGVVFRFGGPTAVDGGTE